MRYYIICDITQNLCRHLKRFGLKGIFAAKPDSFLFEIYRLNCLMLM